MENPFHTTESDFDPIMVAARLANERRLSAVAPPTHVFAKMTPSFSTITAAEQQQQIDNHGRLSVWRHSRTPSSSSSSSSCSSVDTPFLPPRSQSVLNIMVLGKTGDGKSSLLNDMFDRQVFKQKTSVKSQTQHVLEHQGFWAPLNPYLHGKQTFGCHVRVFDTPGFGDSLQRDDQFIPNIQQHIKSIATYVDGKDSSGMHCFFMVFKVTTSEEQVFKSLDIVQSLLPTPLSTETNSNFWNNIILVFTHADLSTAHRYQSNKVALRTKVAYNIMERYHLAQELPMIFISTQKYTCSYIKGAGECDCERGNRYNADSRRRLYEQVWKRRTCPYFYPADNHETKEDQEDQEDEEDEEDNDDQEVYSSNSS